MVSVNYREEMITKKYSKINLINFFPFAYHILKSNKTEELFSFLIWELSWIFFKKKMKQLVFCNENAKLKLDNGIDDLNFISDDSFYESPIAFSLAYFDKNNKVWGASVNEPSKLFFKNECGNIVKCFEFEAIIEGIYIDRKDNIFVCSGGEVFKSINRGVNFKKVLNFSSKESRFLFETVTETENNQILIGEYANVKKNNNWIFVGYIYLSADNGETWETIDFLKKHINKHIHVVKWVERLKCLVLTEGDNKKGTWINTSEVHLSQTKNKKNGWYRLNTFHIQKGGYTGFVETEENILLGTDYYLGTNFIVSTKDFKKFTSQTIPDPYRKSAVFRMLYLKNHIIWASLYCHINPHRSLLMYSEDFGKTWNKFLEYDGSFIKISMISNSGGNCFYILIEDLILNKFRTYVVSSLENQKLDIITNVGIKNK